MSYSLLNQWELLYKHDQKGKFFVPLTFKNEMGPVTLDCQLDTGATCDVMSKTDVCAILHTTNPPLQTRNLTTEML